jgi:hypothetical protein
MFCGMTALTDSNDIKAVFWRIAQVMMPMRGWRPTGTRLCRRPWQFALTNHFVYSPLGFTFLRISLLVLFGSLIFGSLRRWLRGSACLRYLAFGRRPILALAQAQRFQMCRVLKILALGLLTQGRTRIAFMRIVKTRFTLICIAIWLCCIAMEGAIVFLISAFRAPLHPLCSSKQGWYYDAIEEQ